jgi:hypothetical protein
VGRSRISAAISESHVTMTKKRPTVGWIEARWKLEQHTTTKTPAAKVVSPSNQNLFYIEATLSEEKTGKMRSSRRTRSHLQPGLAGTRRDSERLFPYDLEESVTGRFRIVEIRFQFVCSDRCRSMRDCVGSGRGTKVLPVVPPCDFQVGRYRVYLYPFVNESL